MGKSRGKKRRRNEDQRGKSEGGVALARKLLKKSQNGLPADNDTHDDAHISADGPRHGVSDDDLEVTVATLQRLSGQIDPGTGKLAIKDRRYKALRRVVYEWQARVGTPLVSSIASEISTQIDNGAYERAIESLKKSQTGGSKYTPKLGSIQRWVRQIDAAGTGNPLALKVLDAILRVSAPESVVPVAQCDIEKSTWARMGGINTAGEKSNLRGLRIFPPFDRRRQRTDLDDRGETTTQAAEGDIVEELVQNMQIGVDGIRRFDQSLRLDDYRARLFRVCGSERGKDRKPANKFDLHIVTTAPLATGLNRKTFSGIDILSGDNEYQRGVKKIPLPHVRDSFLLQGVLSPDECVRLIAAAETCSYQPDEPIQGQPGESTLAHACVWMVDQTLSNTIFDRVKAHLPIFNSAEIGQDFNPIGLNRRFRFYRYVPGRYYRPHIDGAWPTSGLDKHGNYRYDIFDAENKNGRQFVKGDPSMETCASSRRELSRLTFLIYLNEVRRY